MSEIKANIADSEFTVVYIKNYIKITYMNSIVSS